LLLGGGSFASNGGIALADTLHSLLLPLATFQAALEAPGKL
jgi:hypothetical protein